MKLCVFEGRKFLFPGVTDYKKPICISNVQYMYENCQKFYIVVIDSYFLTWKEPTGISLHSV